MKTLAILLLTLSLSACSIEPLANATEPTDQTTEPTNQTDKNEPNNGTPNQPELTYISCRDVQSCAGLADCFDTFVSLCGAPITDGFYCGDERATLYVRGSLECGEAVVAAMDCCADIERAYEGAE